MEHRRSVIARPIRSIELGEAERHALLKIIKNPISQQRMIDRPALFSAGLTGWVRSKWLRKSACVGRWCRNGRRGSGRGKSMDSPRPRGRVANRACRPKFSNPSSRMPPDRPQRARDGVCARWQRRSASPQRQRTPSVAGQRSQTPSYSDV